MEGQFQNIFKDIHFENTVLKQIDVSVPWPICIHIHQEGKQMDTVLPLIGRIHVQRNLLRESIVIQASRCLASQWAFGTALMEHLPGRNPSLLSWSFAELSKYLIESDDQILRQTS